jgi:hypothetical protein
LKSCRKTWPRLNDPHEVRVAGNDLGHQYMPLTCAGFCVTPILAKFTTHYAVVAYAKSEWSYTAHSILSCILCGHFAFRNHPAKYSALQELKRPTRVAFFFVCIDRQLARLLSEREPSKSGVDEHFEWGYHAPLFWRRFVTLPAGSSGSRRGGSTIWSAETTAACLLD